MKSFECYDIGGYYSLEFSKFLTSAVLTGSPWALLS